MKGHIRGTRDEVRSELTEAARGIRILVELEPEDAARAEVHERGQRLVEPLCLCLKATVLVATDECRATGQPRLCNPDGPVAKTESRQRRLELREVRGRRIGRQVVVKCREVELRGRRIVRVGQDLGQELACWVRRQILKGLPPSTMVAVGSISLMVEDVTSSRAAHWAGVPFQNSARSGSFHTSQ